MDPFPCVNIVWPEVSAHAFCALTHTKVYRYPLTKISGGSLSWVRLHLVKKRLGLVGPLAGCFPHQNAQHRSGCLPWAKMTRGWLVEWAKLVLTEQKELLWPWRKCPRRLCGH